MSGRVPHAELNAVRALVADGLAEITAVGDTGQLWIRAACTRLSAVDGILTEAAGVLAAPVQVLAATIVTFLVVTFSATLASVAGLSTAGVLVTTTLAVLLTLAATPRAARWMTVTLGRHRLSHAPLPHRPAIPAPRGASPGRAPAAPLGPDRSSSLLGGDRYRGQASVKGQLGEAGVPLTGDRTLPGLSGVPDRLLRARVRLVSLALRRAGTADWSAPLLRRAIRTDPVIRRLAHADQLLCQAIDCLERHLDDLREDPA